MRHIWKIIPMLLVTSLICMFWLDDFIAILVFALCFYIFVPSIIASVFITLFSCRLANRWQKYLFGWGIFNLLFFLAYLTFSSPSKDCNAFLMAEHYKENVREMEEFLQYVDEALDDSASIHLEFEEGEPVIFHVAAKGDTEMSYHWRGAAERNKEMLMKTVGLTQEEYENIRKRLNKMDCIGFEMFSSHRADKSILYFKRVLAGMYSFVLYHRPINQDEKDEYMRDWQYIPYNEQVIFMYGGGAFGPQTFPKEEREDFLLKHKPW